MTTPATQLASETPPGDPLLRVEDLWVERPVGRGWHSAVRGASLLVERAQSVGIVGESGSGKSTLATAVLRLLPDSQARVRRGSAEFEGRDLLKMRRRDLDSVRGSAIGMIFQQPVRYLHPAFRVGDQVAEMLRRHRGMTRREAEAEAVELLQAMGIPDAARRYHAYPHEFSGGMCQRVMIAIAVACRPRLLIADEPTTALDVTIQAQVLDLLGALRRDHDLALVLISHDLAAVATVCDRIVVMYGGEVVETGPTAAVLSRPKHPYTAALIAAATPDTSSPPGETRLPTIPGAPPIGEVAGCRFAARCPLVSGDCTVAPIAYRGSVSGEGARCIRHGGPH